MSSAETLAQLFEKFPGIGPRQAGRFVHYLLKSSPFLRKQLVEAIQDLSRHVQQCPECFRFHEGSQKQCERCSDRRSKNTLMVVATDTDADAIERTRCYDGAYFIFGGTVILGSEKQPHLREKEFTALLKKKHELQEVVLAFPANPEGDMTGARAKEVVEGVNAAIRVTSLGRGLSTGSELEYADKETLINALENRK